MNKFFSNIKTLINSNSKETSMSLDKAFKLMDEEFKNATNAYDKDFFPQEKVLSPEEMHYSNLNLPPNSDFEDINKSYKNLKSKYEQENDLENLAKLDYSYKYFKQKFNI